MRDSFDLRSGVNHGVRRALLAVAESFDRLWFSEIKACGQFADNQNIDSCAMTLLHNRTDMGKLFPQNYRTQICEKLKFFAQPQQRGAFRALISRNSGV